MMKVNKNFRIMIVLLFVMPLARGEIKRNYADVGEIAKNALLNFNSTYNDQSQYYFVREPYFIVHSFSSEVLLLDKKVRTMRLNPNFIVVQNILNYKSNRKKSFFTKVSFPDGKNNGVKVESNLSVVFSGITQRFSVKESESDDTAFEVLFNSDFIINFEKKYSKEGYKRKVIPIFTGKVKNEKPTEFLLYWEKEDGVFGFSDFPSTKIILINVNKSEIIAGIASFENF